MSVLFLKIVNMSIAASWLILAVLAVRLCLRKAPKRVNVLLWGLVAVRLLCPLSLESVFSVIPSGETIPLQIEMDTTPAIDSGITSFDRIVNPMIADSNTPMVGASVNPLQITVAIYESIWLLGVWALLCYAAISTLGLSQKLKTAVRYGDNVFQSEYIQSPFVFGLIQPKIYLPYHVEEESLRYILAHEQAHIRRRDHWWEPLGFLLLTIHWFNPLMWAAYVLLCRDIELACDEAVIGELDPPRRADYSEALLRCSGSRRSVTACPVAFGEVGVKQRVKSVLHYKKPGIWMVLLCVLLCVVLAACFLTDPAEDGKEPLGDGCYLTVKAEGIVSIEVITPTHSGGVINADGSPFEVGEIVWLEPLDPFDTFNDLRGVTIKARNGNDETVYEISFPEQATDADIRARLLNSWVEAVCDSVRPMTIEDVIRLSKKGDSLTWEDVELYAHTETGSGLYIWRFEINEMFSLLVGGSGIDAKPMYIKLIANDGSDTYIDIRDGGVEEYVAEHKDNPPVTSCTAGWHCSPVGHDFNGYTKMLELNGYSGEMYMSRIKLLPVVTIHSKDELEAFMQETDSVMDFDASYADAPSFRTNLALWDESFFSESQLYLVYLYEGRTGYRHTVEFVTYSQGQLSIGVQCLAPLVGDDVVEGWILAVGVPKEQTVGVSTVKAFISSAIVPDESVESQ